MPEVHNITVDFDKEKTVGGIDGWYWPSIDIQTFGFIKGDWEQSHRKTIYTLMNQFQKPMNTVIQAGGNCGMYPKLLSKMFKNVYTFEPDPLNFFTLGLNCSEPNIYKIQGAVGAEPGFVSMIHRTFINVGMHQVKQEESSVIPLFTLDSLPFKDVDLLWLDIEEYEINAFKGAVKTINNNQPVILCENPIDSIIQFLDEECGYEHLGNTFSDGIFYKKQK